VTWDQGIEMVNHTLFTHTTGVPVYFAEARSPWQRGSNENTNGLLRQYLPKGSDLRQHSATDLDAIAQALNDRPTQTLGWRTPSEVFNAVVAITAEAAVSPGGQFSAVVDRTKIYPEGIRIHRIGPRRLGRPTGQVGCWPTSWNQPQHGRAGVGRARRQTGIAALSRKAPTKPSEVAAKKDSNHSIVCMICRVCVAEWRQPDGASGSMQQCPNGFTAARSVRPRPESPW
jgi:IS30 family transposase